MTTETSNARGLVGYVDGSRLRELRDGRLNIALWAEPMGSADTPVYTIPTPPPPAAAEPKTLPVPTRVYLTDKAAVIVGDPQRGWDEEVPEAHNCDDMGCSTIGPHVLARVPFTDERALSQPAEARGVVDEGSRSVTRQLLHWDGVPVHVTGTVTTSPGNWSLIDAALATQHREPTTCKHDFRRDEDHGGACCQLCGEVRQ